MLRDYILQITGVHNRQPSQQGLLWSLSKGYISSNYCSTPSFSCMEHIITQNCSISSVYSLLRILKMIKHFKNSIYFYP